MVADILFPGVFTSGLCFVILWWNDALRGLVHSLWTVYGNTPDSHSDLLRLTFNGNMATDCQHPANQTGPLSSHYEQFIIFYVFGNADRRHTTSNEVEFGRKPSWIPVQLDMNRSRTLELRTPSLCTREWNDVHTAGGHSRPNVFTVGQE